MGEWWDNDPEDQTKPTLRQYRDTLENLLKEKEKENIKVLLFGVCFRYKLIGLARFQDENDTISYKGYVKTLTSPEIKEYEALYNKDEDVFEIHTEDRESPITVRQSNMESFGLKATFS